MSKKSKGRYPYLSLVIITKDREHELTKLLKSISKVDYPKNKIEIVLVDASKHPLKLRDIKRILNSKNIKRIEPKDVGFPYARNFGVKNASHNLIVFVDDDCVVTKRWLKELVSCIDKAPVVCGGVLAKNPNLIGRCEEAVGYPAGGIKKIKKSGGKIVETNIVSTCNSILKKYVFDDVGYFDEDMKRGSEDTEFSKRVSKKYRILFNPKATIYHKPRNSIVRVFRWFVRQGRGQLRLMLKDRDFLSRLIIPHSLFVFLLSFFVLLMMIGVGGVYVWCFVFLVYYLMMVFLYRFRHNITGFDVLFVLPFVFFIMMIGRSIGHYIEFFSSIKNYLKF